MIAFHINTNFSQCILIRISQTTNPACIPPTSTENASTIPTANNSPHNPHLHKHHTFWTNGHKLNLLLGLARCTYS